MQQHYLPIGLSLFQETHNNPRMKILSWTIEMHHMLQGVPLPVLQFCFVSPNKVEQSEIPFGEPFQMQFSMKVTFANILLGDAML